MFAISIADGAAETLMILLQFLLRVGVADGDDLIAVMGRSLVRRCQTQFLWWMAPRDDGDDGMIWVEGGMTNPSIHPLLILSLPGCCILLQTQPLLSPISMADVAA